MAKSKTQGGMKLKKFLSVLCLICLLFSCASVTAMAAGKGKIEGSSCTTERGKTVEFSLKLKENPGIWGTKIKIKYNDSALMLKSVTAGKVFDESEITCSEKIHKNPYVVVATGKTAKNKTTTGTLVTLKFEVSDIAAYKEYPIEVDVVQSINATGKDVNMDSADGSITVEKEQVKPSEPGDNEDPTEPTKPVDPTKPTEPSKPSEPTDPSDPTDPSEPNDPTEPSKPTKPGDGNDDSSEPSEGNDDLTEPGEDDGNKPSDDEGGNTPEDESEGNVDVDENTNEDSTGTGDNSMIAPFVCIMVAALAVFVATIKRRRS